VKISHTLLSLVVAAITATTFIFAGEPDDGPDERPKSGFGIGPGMLVAGNIPVGKEVAPGVEFEIHNYGKTPLALTIRALKPIEAGLATWEKGYEPIPDKAWCKLEKEKVEAAPESITKVKAIFNFPDDPKLSNRKFMVGVALERDTSGNKGGAGISLRMVSRLGIETVAREDVDGAGASAVSFIPSILRNNAAKSGQQYLTTLKIRNNREEAVTLTPKTLSEVEADKEKYDRYFGFGRKAVIEESWIKKPDAIALQPGETKTIQLQVHVPPGAKGDKVFEELLFLEDEKKRLEFVRVRTAIATE